MIFFSPCEEQQQSLFRNEPFLIWHLLSLHRPLHLSPTIPQTYLQTQPLPSPTVVFAWLLPSFHMSGTAYRPGTLKISFILRMSYPSIIEVARPWLVAAYTNVWGSRAMFLTNHISTLSIDGAACMGDMRSVLATCVAMGSDVIQLGSRAPPALDSN